MPEEKESLALDARLLSDAIIELNISRRNVAVYPKGHPSVARSLGNAFDYLQKLFELRPEITLAVAKDTLIIDESFLDKKNPVYKDFAETLAALSIAHVTFRQGVTHDELYVFQKVVCMPPAEATPAAIQEYSRENRMVHITLQFVDFDAFAFIEGASEESDQRDERIWEKYIYGLLNDSLIPDDLANAVREIPPWALASFLGDVSPETLKEDSYDRVIANYMHRTSDRAFSAGDLRKILDFINSLKPELKKDFLKSTVKQVSTDMATAQNALKDVSADEVIELLTVINEQKVSLPESLSNLLTRFSTQDEISFPEQKTGNEFVIDDVFLSAGVRDLLNAGNFEQFVTESYQKEIQGILQSTPFVEKGSVTKQFLSECSDEFLDVRYTQIVLELIREGILEAEDYPRHLEDLGNLTQELLDTGQYLEIIKVLMVLGDPGVVERIPDSEKSRADYFFSRPFLKAVVQSFRSIGRLKREEGIALCDFYGDRMIPPLLGGIMEEESQAARRFLISLVIEFGESVVPHVLKHLKDQRWYVTRNMLYILGEAGRKEHGELVRPLCRSENRKIAVEAVRTLLRLGDPYGVGMVRRFLRSEDAEETQQGIALAGSFRLREMAPELLNLLNRPAVGGADYYVKNPVVRALGEIGDPAALPSLKTLVSARTLLFKSHADALKLEIFKSLRNYPYDAVRDLVETGLKAKSEAVRNECIRVQAAGTR